MKLILCIIISTFIISSSLLASECLGPYKIYQFAYHLDDDLADCFYDQQLENKSKIEDAIQLALSKFETYQDFYYNQNLNDRTRKWCKERFENPTSLYVNKIHVFGSKSTNGSLCTAFSIR